MICYCDEYRPCNICIAKRAKTVFVSSGNKVIDDFIWHTQTNLTYGQMEFVPYYNFKDVEFFAEGGFSKIYKATWINGPMDDCWNAKKQMYNRTHYKIVALKELNNSKNISSEELNEVIFYFILLISKIKSLILYNFYFSSKFIMIF
jgi:hypothetical protein